MCHYVACSADVFQTLTMSYVRCFADILNFWSRGRNKLPRSGWVRSRGYEWGGGRKIRLHCRRTTKMISLTYRLGRGPKGWWYKIACHSRDTRTSPDTAKSHQHKNKTHYWMWLQFNMCSKWLINDLGKIIRHYSQHIGGYRRKMLPAIRVDGENRIEGTWTKLMDAESQLSC